MHVATSTKRWTLEELHRLPDDGNKYELVRGELFVTPAPAPHHEVIVARLARILEPFVHEHDLGYVYRPRSIVRFDKSEVEPDLMVRQPPPADDTAWEDWPVPTLVVEVMSDVTRRRDRMQKRDFYLDAGVAEYWIVDGERRTVTSVRPGTEDVVAHDRIVWAPPHVPESLAVEFEGLFGVPPAGR